MRVLVVTAVQAEKEAILRGLHNDSRFDVIEAGVGPAAAAAGTAVALTRAANAAAASAGDHYGLVISAGIGGGYRGRAEVGSLVIASKIVAADLGAETPTGFLSIEDLGFGTSRIAVDDNITNQVVAALKAAQLSVHKAAILTLSTVTGTIETADELIRRIPDAAAEAMEGYGVAAVAHQLGLPVLEIRAISNIVGPRDRSSWRIDQALKALETASMILKEVL